MATIRYEHWTGGFPALSPALFDATLKQKAVKMDFVIYLIQDWKSYYPRIKGYFCDVPFIRAFAKMPGVRILCVNRPFTPIETCFTKREKAASWIKGDRLEQLGENLFLFTPFSFVHDMVASYSQSFQKMNRFILSKQVNKLLERLNFNSSVRASWIYHPLQYTYYGLANENHKIYVCWDLYDRREQPEKLRMKTIEYERKIVSECDLLLTPLVNSYREKKTTLR